MQLRVKDLISALSKVDENEIVFVEVKTRTQKNFGRPAEAVDINKKHHIYTKLLYLTLVKDARLSMCTIYSLIIVENDDESRVHTS